MRVGRLLLVLFLCSGVLCAANSLALAQEYVGTKACADCHEGQYARFMEHSKKAHSWKSISVMASDLTAEEKEGCYECHTTGYGKGGFISYEKTPHLADVGCETCHGPGGEHVESGGDPETIRKTPELADCESCHNESRIGAFDFRPLIHSGAH
ncbi:cytochrome c family protein [Desulfovibrio mangrovi]|uniref:cytochrome c family protein n=1 Tax=Desulfovibrio mangrovi TaxID=2976983 RepID=UPI002246976F|nr:cytochrome c family protein [Desulfovibrio mangrovi]UZP65998.1 cytochrome c family protein [Desulfovibrio mangrovi]